MAALLLVVYAHAASQTASQKTSPTGADVTKGNELFTSYGCYECHGRQAQGSRTSGPRLAPNPIPFPAFVKYIRQPKGQMPPYTDKVASQADLQNIYAFLKSIPQPPKNVPLLK